MNTDRIYPEWTEARDAVVTYSRVPSRKRAGGLAVVERVEPRLDAAEVPLIDPHDDVDAAFAAPRPELRADAIDAGAADKRGRRGSMQVVFLGAALAIVAGFGVLAGTIGVATIIPGGSPADGELTAPLRLTSAEATPDMSAEKSPERSMEPAAVREIPLAAGEEAPAAEASATVIAPPLPRPRPDVQAASLEPEPEAGMVLPPAEPEAAKAPDPKPIGSGGGEAPPKAAASSEPQGTDRLITNIEETLEKIDSAPAGAASANVALPPPAVLPAPPLEASVPPSLYPPVHDECPPPGSGFDPCYDVMPPEPLTDNGYYQAGPVPPESVPYPYPPSDSDGHDTFAADGSTTSAGDAPEEAERRPGIVRRAITRTADAVGRVLGRDR